MGFGMWAGLCRRFSGPALPPAIKGMASVKPIGRDFDDGSEDHNKEPGFACTFPHHREDHRDLRVPAGP